MLFEDWAAKWGVPRAALHDLQVMLTCDDPEVRPLAGMSEAAVTSRVRLEAADKGILLWRNNVGVLLDKRDVPVRFGLANESKEQNKRLKSSDFIGIKPTLVTAEMVGATLGLFVAPEMKEGDWHFNPNDEHEAAQAAFHTLVRKNGGWAGFVHREGMLP